MDLVKVGPRRDDARANCVYSCRFAGRDFALRSPSVIDQRVAIFYSQEVAA